MAFAVIACVSLAVGNIAALVQRSVKRLLAYSSVSHAGFMLIAGRGEQEHGAQALIYYLIPYFGDVPRRLRGGRGARARAGRAGDAARICRASAGSGRSTASRCGCSCSASRLPADRRLLGKIYVFAAAYDSGWSGWLIVVGVVATMVSARLLPGRRARDVPARQHQRGPGDTPAPAGGSPPRDRPLTTAVGACVVHDRLVLLREPLIDVAPAAANSLPFYPGRC